MIELIAFTAFIVAVASATYWLTTQTERGRRASTELGAAVSMRPQALGSAERWIDLDQLPPILDSAEAQLDRLDAELARGNEPEVTTIPCTPPDWWDDIPVDTSDFDEPDRLDRYDARPPEHTGARLKSPAPEELAQAVGQSWEIPPPPPVAHVPHWPTDEEEN